MWTSNGCRGEFMCDGHTVAANDEGAGTHSFDCQGAETVTCVPWITPLQRKILFNTEVLGVNQDVTPQGRPLNGSDISIWTRALSDGTVAVAFYNEDDASIEVALEFASLAAKHGAHWGPTTTAVVRDLWEFTNTTATGRFPARGTLEVAAHQTILLRLFP